MSMRGEIISKEYQRMVFVHDKEGREFACYADELNNFRRGEDLTAEERQQCTDMSHVLGDTW